LLAGTAGMVFAADTAVKTSKTVVRPVVTKPPAFRFDFKPPVGAPASRSGGGTRGLNNVRGLGLSDLWVLAPKQTGLTHQEQPILYWYLDKAVKNATLLFSLYEHASKQTTFEFKRYEHTAPGMQKLDLAALDVRLKPGVEYRWTVGASHTDTLTSNDPFAEGGIRYQPLPAAEQQKLQTATPYERIPYYAQNGYWYTVMDEMIPVKNPLFTNQLIQLLNDKETVDLPEVANALGRAASVN